MKCGRCQDFCHGNVVTVQDKYFHQYCFSCIKCSRDLLTDGYFVKDGEVYCTNDYYELINTEKCSSCHKYVEGEVISVKGSVFHPECFGCQQCGKLFPEGASIIFDGDGYICDECDQANQRRNQPQEEVPESRYNGHQYNGGSYSPRKADSHYINYREYPREEESPQQQEPVLDERSKVAPPPYQMQFESKHAVEQKPAVNRSTSDSHNNCAGCGNDIRSGQALLALDKQWHLWCFTCHKCGCLLAGEYMGRDGLPYCEDDYQKEFGVTCAGCDGYITGKVLQAGEKHYHPQCSRCAKCQKIFGEGEEMYLQGSEIWHPQCSEEYRRENEELMSTEEENRREPPSYESTVDSIRPPNQSFQRTVDPNRSPEEPSRPKPVVNGYDYHSRQFSTSSSEGARNDPPFTESPVSGGGTWQPPGAQSSVTSRPAGFRSVRPPQSMVSSVDEKPPDEEDAGPPVPPPPIRGSSNSWKQKYTNATGVYAAKPFQKQSESKPQGGRRPLSFVESAVRKELSNENLSSTGDDSYRERSRHYSGSASSGGDDETGRRDTGTSRPYIKGVGYNKLQLRKLQQQQQQQPKVNGHQQSPPDHIDGKQPSYDVNKVNSKDKTSYLTDDEFTEVFNMPREKFHALPKWRQEDMKRAKYLL